MASTPPATGFAGFLRRLERLMGAHREDRSLWAWAGPISTLVATFTALIAFGIVNGVDLPLTIPMAVVMALLMGTLSAFYLTASSADEADGDDGSAHPGLPSSPPPLRADPFRKVPQGDRVAVLDRHVPAVEQFKAHVVDPEVAQRVPERDGSQVEKELVPGARVDVHGAK
jgi:hypothetical protein